MTTTLIAFSRRFGPLDWAPVQENGRRFVEGKPELYIVSNVLENGVAIGSLGVRRTGMAHRHVVSRRPAQGEHALCDRDSAAGREHVVLQHVCGVGHAAGALQQRCIGLRIKHDGTYNSGGYLRDGVTATDDPRSSPGAVHPLVCRHPESGRQCLYLGRRRNAYLVGMGLEESEALLNALWAHVDDPALAWTHAWRVGDLVMWDNRCTMHKREPFDCGSRRIMHRTQIKGEARPVA